METNCDMENEAQQCFGIECSHAKTLDFVLSVIRKISHDFSQPLMVMQGYLELMELGKMSSDAESLKSVIVNISSQLQTLLVIQEKLKQVVRPERMRFAE